MVQAQKFQMKPKYTMAQKMRFPLIFGSILGVFVVGFMNRKVFFGDEIEEVRRKNYEEAFRQQVIMDRAKESIAEAVATKTKAK